MGETHIIILTATIDDEEPYEEITVYGPFRDEHDQHEAVDHLVLWCTDTGVIDTKYLLTHLEDGLPQLPDKQLVLPTS